MTMQPTKVVRVYAQKNGKIPFEDWLFSSKDKRLITSVSNTVQKFQFGNLGDWKSLGEGLFESRIHYGAGYRLYFTFAGQIMIVLLCGGEKKTQKKDIAKAKEYAKDVKKRAEEFSKV